MVGTHNGFNRIQAWFARLIAANGRLPLGSSHGPTTRSPLGCRRARVRQGQAFGGAEEAPSLTAAARDGDGNMGGRDRKNAPRRGSNKRMNKTRAREKMASPLTKKAPYKLRGGHLGHTAAA